MFILILDKNTSKVLGLSFKCLLPKDFKNAKFCDMTAL